jgi:serine/threonine-protein kinase
VTAQSKEGKEGKEGKRAEIKGGERLVDRGEIASGGQATVRRVFDTNLLRPLAMKVLDPDLTKDAGQRQRFVEEAQITGQLDHPNIPPVHELGISGDGRFFFTMKLVQGKTLEEILSEPDFSPEREEDLFRALTIFMAVCNAVSFAHSLGVVHRDIKPDNVMVGDYGQVYLMDWGIALLRDREPPTMEGPRRVRLWARAQDERNQVLGTPEYMSPEQANGLVENVDERTDVFCLGAVLYRIVAGRAPYAARTSIASLAAAAGALFPPVERAARGVVPPRLAQIVARAMAPDPKDRYASVEVLRAEIEKYTRGTSNVPVKRFEAGSLVMREGDPGDAAYVITSGKARVFKFIDGTKTVVREMGPGEVFGEAAIFAAAPRSASVEAMEPLGVVVLTRELLQRELGQTAWMGPLVNTLADRFREIDARATELRAEADRARIQLDVLEHIAFHGVARSSTERTVALRALCARVAAAHGMAEDRVVAAIRRMRHVIVDAPSDLLILTSP